MPARLVMHGEVDLDLNEQIGDPDGDTLMVFNPQVMVNGASDATLTRRLHLTSVKVRGEWKPAVTYRRTGGTILSYLRLRFFGMDTPETHYSPIPRDDDASRDPTLTPPFRQHCAYLAKQALEVLANQGLGRDVEVQRTLPNLTNFRHLFDSYGRSLGYLYAEDVNVNYQMIHAGMAFPFIFDDMPGDEIQTIQQAAQSAFDQSPDRSSAGQFTHELVTELDTQAPAPLFDPGPVNLPRIFRRFVEWRLFHAEDSTFVAWLRQSHHNSRWRRNGTGTTRKLADALDDSGNLLEELQPWEIVYRQDQHDVPTASEYSENPNRLNQNQRSLRVQVGLIPN